MAHRAKDNPFSVDRILQLEYRLRNDTWEALFERFRQAGYRGAIVGPEGAGKTTLLEELAVRFGEQGHDTFFIRLSRGSRRRVPFAVLAEQATEQTVVLLDGAEQVGLVGWRRLLRHTAHCRGLIITAHRPSRLPTIIECTGSRAVLQQILQDLLGDEANVWCETADQLFENHRGNIRDVLREFYDIFSRRHVV